MRYRLHQDKLSGPALFISRCVDPETITIQQDGLEKDENNEIYAHEGSFIDKDGKVITLTKGEGLEFSADPVGILTEAVNVTDGAQAGSLMRRGTIYADKIPYPEGVEYEESFMASIEAKLPHILCVGSRTPATSAGAAGAASSSVDLSKATGTLAVKNGGTGATSASEALDALLESQPLPITKGGTGASDKDTAVTNLGAQKAGE